jgi:hypothetical protein
MSNVLPPERKYEAWRMQRARLLIALSLVLLCAAALSAFAMAPSYIALSISPEVSAPFSSGDDTDRSAIAQSQILLKTLSPLFAATTTPTDAIEAALSQRPQGVLVTHITYTASTPGSLIIAGSAPSPEAINAYQEALQADPHFSSATVPVADLAGAENGNFSITLSGNF